MPGQGVGEQQEGVAGYKLSGQGKGKDVPTQRNLCHSDCGSMKVNFYWELKVFSNCACKTFIYLKYIMESEMLEFAIQLYYVLTNPTKRAFAHWVQHSLLHKHEIPSLLESLIKCKWQSMIPSYNKNYVFTKIIHITL